MDIKERRIKILLALILRGGFDYEAITIDQTFSRVYDIVLNQKTKSTIGLLQKTGLIEVIEEEQTVAESGAINTNSTRLNVFKTKTVRLTQKGFDELCLIFPYFRFYKTNWDGKWRILSYEIPEKKREVRDKLRRKVAGWGLGPWHRSFWITPHPIIGELRALVGGHEEEQYVQAFEAEHVFGQRDQLIEKVWNKTHLHKEYQVVFKKWHLILSEEAEKLDKLAKITSVFIGILKEDPGLPREVLGQDWTGFDAYSIYKEIQGILLT
jgi:phenylacetic acid degradation operon negative regulatory protein